MVVFAPDRRRFLTGLGTGAALLPLSGCEAFDDLSNSDNGVRNVLEAANGLTYRMQRLLGGGHALAREFSEADIRQPQRPNGVTAPDDADYKALASTGFADYRLTVNGMVKRPQALALDHLMTMPPRTQITRHDCVEGWSCIAKWTGVPLARVLDLAEPLPAARFALFSCFDTIERSLAGLVKYYESVDLVDARHPQTILAYGLNGKALPVENGAPLRLRVERQLGYKMAKYVHTITLVDKLDAFGLGKGGYWEDRGYDWYAGI